MPMAMGRSKLGPSLRTSAGARLMVVRPMGNLNPEFVSAVETRSRDSFTATSGNPTMTTTVSPQPEFTSTSTGKASMPLTAEDKTRASIRGYWAKAGARAMRFLHLCSKNGLSGHGSEAKHTTEGLGENTTESWLSLDHAW